MSQCAPQQAFTPTASTATTRKAEPTAAAASPLQRHRRTNAEKNAPVWNDACIVKAENEMEDNEKAELTQSSCLPLCRSRPPPTAPIINNNNSGSSGAASSPPSKDEDKHAAAKLSPEKKSQSSSNSNASSAWESPNLLPSVGPSHPSLPQLPIASEQPHTQCGLGLAAGVNTVVGEAAPFAAASSWGPAQASQISPVSSPALQSDSTLSTSHVEEPAESPASLTISLTPPLLSPATEVIHLVSSAQPAAHRCVVTSAPHQSCDREKKIRKRMARHAPILQMPLPTRKHVRALGGSPAGVPDISFPELEDASTTANATCSDFTLTFNALLWRSAAAAAASDTEDMLTGSVGPRHSSTITSIPTQFLQPPSQHTARLSTSPSFSLHTESRHSSRNLAKARAAISSAPSRSASVFFGSTTVTDGSAPATSKNGRGGSLVSIARKGGVKSKRKACKLRIPEAASSKDGKDGVQETVKMDSSSFPAYLGDSVELLQPAVASNGSVKILPLPLPPYVTSTTAAVVSRTHRRGVAATAAAAAADSSPPMLFLSSSSRAVALPNRSRCNSTTTRTCSSSADGAVASGGERRWSAIEPALSVLAEETQLLNIAVKPQEYITQASARGTAERKLPSIACLLKEEGSTIGSSSPIKTSATSAGERDGEAELPVENSEAPSSTPNTSSHTVLHTSFGSTADTFSAGVSFVSSTSLSSASSSDKVSQMTPLSTRRSERRSTAACAVGAGMRCPQLASTPRPPSSATTLATTVPGLPLLSLTSPLSEVSSPLLPKSVKCNGNSSNDNSLLVHLAPLNSTRTVEEAAQRSTKPTHDSVLLSSAQATLNDAMAPIPALPPSKAADATPAEPFRLKESIRRVSRCRQDALALDQRNAGSQTVPTDLYGYHHPPALAPEAASSAPINGNAYPNRPSSLAEMGEQSSMAGSMPDRRPLLAPHTYCPRLTSSRLLSTPTATTSPALPPGALLAAGTLTPLVDPPFFSESSVFSPKTWQEPQHYHDAQQQQQRQSLSLPTPLIQGTSLHNTTAEPPPPPTQTPTPHLPLWPSDTSPTTSTEGEKTPVQWQKGSTSFNASGSPHTEDDGSLNSLTAAAATVCPKGVADLSSDSPCFAFTGSALMPASVSHSSKLLSTETSLNRTGELLWGSANSDTVDNAVAEVTAMVTGATEPQQHDNSNGRALTASSSPPELSSQVIVGGNSISPVTGASPASHLSPIATFLLPLARPFHTTRSTANNNSSAAVPLPRGPSISGSSSSGGGGGGNPSMPFRNVVGLPSGDSILMRPGEAAHHFSSVSMATSILMTASHGGRSASPRPQPGTAAVTIASANNGVSAAAGLAASLTRSATSTPVMGFSRASPVFTSFGCMTHNTGANSPTAPRMAGNPASVSLSPPMYHLRRRSSANVPPTAATQSLTPLTQFQRHRSIASMSSTSSMGGFVLQSSTSALMLRHGVPHHMAEVSLPGQSISSNRGSNTSIIITSGEESGAVGVKENADEDEYLTLSTAHRVNRRPLHQSKRRTRVGVKSTGHSGRAGGASRRRHRSLLKPGTAIELAILNGVHGHRSSALSLINVGDGGNAGGRAFGVVGRSGAHSVPQTALGDDGEPLEVSLSCAASFTATSTSASETYVSSSFGSVSPDRPKFQWPPAADALVDGENGGSSSSSTHSGATRPYHGAFCAAVPASSLQPSPNDAGGIGTENEADGEGISTCMLYKAAPMKYSFYRIVSRGDISQQHRSTPLPLPYGLQQQQQRRREKRHHRYVRVHHRRRSNPAHAPSSYHVESPVSSNTMPCVKATESVQVASLYNPVTDRAWGGVLKRGTIDQQANYAPEADLGATKFYSSPSTRNATSPHNTSSSLSSSRPASARAVYSPHLSTSSLLYYNDVDSDAVDDVYYQLEKQLFPIREEQHLQQPLPPHHTAVLAQDTHDRANGTDSAEDNEQLDSLFTVLEVPFRLNLRGGFHLSDYYAPCPVCHPAMRRPSATAPTATSTTSTTTEDVSNSVKRGNHTDSSLSVCSCSSSSSSSTSSDDDESSSHSSNRNGRSLVTLLSASSSSTCSSPSAPSAVSMLSSLISATGIGFAFASGSRLNGVAPPRSPRYPLNSSAASGMNGMITNGIPRVCSRGSLRSFSAAVASHSHALSRRRSAPSNASVVASAGGNNKGNSSSRISSVRIVSPEKATGGVTSTIPSPCSLSDRPAAPSMCCADSDEGARQTREGVRDMPAAHTATLPTTKTAERCSCKGSSATHTRPIFSSVAHRGGPMASGALTSTTLPSAVKATPADTQTQTQYPSLSSLPNFSLGQFLALPSAPHSVRSSQVLHFSPATAFISSRRESRPLAAGTSMSAWHLSRYRRRRPRHRPAPVVARQCGHYAGMALRSQYSSLMKKRLLCLRVNDKLTYIDPKRATGAGKLVADAVLLARRQKRREEKWQRHRAEQQQKHEQKAERRHQEKLVAAAAAAARAPSGTFCSRCHRLRRPRPHQGDHADPKCVNHPRQRSCRTTEGIDGHGNASQCSPHRRHHHCTREPCNANDSTSITPRPQEYPQQQRIFGDGLVCFAAQQSPVPKAPVAGHTPAEGTLASALRRPDGATSRSNALHCLVIATENVSRPQRSSLVSHTGGSAMSQQAQSFSCCSNGGSRVPAMAVPSSLQSNPNPVAHLRSNSGSGSSEAAAVEKRERSAHGEPHSEQVSFAKGPTANMSGPVTARRATDGTLLTVPKSTNASEDVHDSASPAQQQRDSALAMLYTSPDRLVATNSARASDEALDNSVDEGERGSEPSLSRLPHNPSLLHGLENLSRHSGGEPRQPAAALHPARSGVNAYTRPPFHAEDREGRRAGLMPSTTSMPEAIEMPYSVSSHLPLHLFGSACSNSVFTTTPPSYPLPLSNAIGAHNGNASLTAATANAGASNSKKANNHNGSSHSYSLTMKVDASWSAVGDARQRNLTALRSAAPPPMAMPFNTPGALSSGMYSSPSQSTSQLGMPIPDAGGTPRSHRRPQKHRRHSHRSRSQSHSARNCRSVTSASLHYHRLTPSLRPQPDAGTTEEDLLNTALAAYPEFSVRLDASGYPGGQQP
ncbi:hypothetical protein ABL78_3399 [Leptomonas seymouri]|uniref:Uncharacterized protein n=1 Tax=Leptomonas seymouri TaxID=5684 RepID=A0A0N1I4U7_LEPSE|nr:hypothetical protein ABL78_3399 [Leptomonas seymouri]|eukprot:KPI87521.1 hypothetical protein ABL78_3399 [Leptomonas seymouri]